MNDILPDSFYSFVDNVLSGSWLIPAIIYASSFLFFNSIMCWVCGGTDAAIGFLLGPTAKVKDVLKNWRKLVINKRETSLHFLEGGKIRWQEMRNDRPTWIWPLLVIFPIVLIYGYGRQHLDETINQMASNNLDIRLYQPSEYNRLYQSIQYIVWLTCLGIVIWTLYRYRYKRSAPTWFSRSIVHHLSQSLIFDLFIFYMVTMTMFAWLSYSIALFRLLRDDSIAYSILSADQLYGLDPAYDTILGMSLVLIGVSLMPLLTYFRERNQSYKWVYFALVYGSLGISVVLLVLLVYSFDQRLAAIKANELNIISSQLNDVHQWHNLSDGVLLSRINVGLEYYQVVSQTPGNFPIPSWLSILVIGRVLFFIYELVAVSSGGASESALSKTLRNLLFD